tara:strand:- start:5148 stop:5375 length:228 start_codon:yes stop_codon:yes gene_type:complete
MSKQVIVIGADSVGKKLAETLHKMKDVDVVLIDSTEAIEKPTNQFLQYPDEDMQKIIKEVRDVRFFKKPKSKFHS